MRTLPSVTDGGAVVSAPMPRTGGTPPAENAVVIGVLSPDEVESLLHRVTVGRIAVSIDNRPYIVPITYAYHRGSVYAHSGPGRKIDGMRAHPHVCFEIDEVIAPAQWRSVVADGVYEELISLADRRDALQLLGHTNDTAQAALDGGEGEILFRVRLTERSGRFEQRELR